jgi:hypothetical protein
MRVTHNCPSGHRDLVAGVGDQVQPVAEPALDLLPLFTGAPIDARRLVFSPVGIRVGDLAGFATDICPVLWLSMALPS